MLLEKNRNILLGRKGIGGTLDIATACLALAALGWLFMAGFSTIEPRTETQPKAIVEVDKSAYREVEKYLNSINSFELPADLASDYPNPEPFREYR